MEEAIEGHARWSHPSRAFPWLRALPNPTGDAASAGATRVTVFARDLILRAGITDQLRGRSDVVVVEERGVVVDSVAVVVADELDDEVVGAIRAIRRCGCPRVVVVVSRLSKAQADAALVCGVRGLLRRAEAGPERLAEVVQCAAANGETVATTGSALRAVLAEPDAGCDQAPPFELTSRDIEVLRLMADGQSTAAIARSLAYSESTIKNAIHTIVAELGARNRAHAVAVALRLKVI